LNGCEFEKIIGENERLFLKALNVMLLLSRSYIGKEAFSNQFSQKRANLISKF